MEIVANLMPILSKSGNFPSYFCLPKETSIKSSNFSGILEAVVNAARIVPQQLPVQRVLTEPYAATAKSSEVVTDSLIVRQ